MAAPQASCQSFEQLDAISRTRPLSDSETRRLYEALRHREGFGQKRWTAGEVRRLKAYLRRGKKPANIAPLLGRTERAVWRMIYRQGWTVRAHGQCSIAVPNEKP